MFFGGDGGSEPVIAELYDILKKDGCNIMKPSEVFSEIS